MATCLCMKRNGVLIRRLFVRLKSFNTYEWMKRRAKDPYIEKARIENYRCRSAFKLLEIDEKFKIIKPGHHVIDIGAAPGSWSQVLVSRTNANGEDPKKPIGMVLAVDISTMADIKGATILQCMDFTEEATQERIRVLLNGRKLNLVLSDMAPNASGVKELDLEKIYNLAMSVLSFAVRNLNSNGTCLLKIWAGRQQEMIKEMSKWFASLKSVVPNSTQGGSSEVYLLGRNFRGVHSLSQMKTRS